MMDKKERYNTDENIILVLVHPLSHRRYSPYAVIWRPASFLIYAYPAKPPSIALF